LKGFAAGTGRSQQGQYQHGQKQNRGYYNRQFNSREARLTLRLDRGIYSHRRKGFHGQPYFKKCLSDRNVDWFALQDREVTRLLASLSKTR
jgi:hypothetical protein